MYNWVYHSSQNDILIKVTELGSPNIILTKYMLNLHCNEKPLFIPYIMFSIF